MNTARSVKLLASGMPFHGQRGVWPRPTMAGEASERVDIDKATKARASMISIMSQIFDLGVIFWRSEDSEL